MARKPVAVFDIDGLYLSHCTYERAKKLVYESKACFIGIDTIKLRKSKRQDIKDKREVVRDERYRCYICNFRIYAHKDLSVDHMIPISRDRKFANVKFNKRCCCTRCNQDKNDMTLSEYVEHIKQHREKYTYISNRRLDYLEGYAKQYEKEYYEKRRNYVAEGGGKLDEHY